MAVITAVVVTIFGGLTLILRDDTFVKMKPTILYCLFAGILGFGLMRGRSYLKYLIDEMIPMRHEGWIKFTRRFVVFYLGLAVLNEIVWRGWGTDTWVNFRTFVLPAANFAVHHGAGAAVPAVRGAGEGGAVIPVPGRTREARPWLPLLESLAQYRLGWLRHDISAGLAIAAVGLPSAIAYPAIAGLPPETGLYASIAPLVAYALFGPSAS